MAAQKGKDLLVKIADGAGFTTVAGLRTRRLAFNAETVDITHAESANRWRELLDGAGVKRASVSGRGLFKDAATDALMRQTFFDGAVKNYQIVIPDFGTVRGRVPDHQSGIRRRAQWRGDLRPGAGIRRRADVHGGVTMPNRHRGEIEAEIGGDRRKLVLTLGALAELEAAFGADDLVALTERFGSGRLKARDLTRIIGAGLRGAGETVSDDEVAAMAVDGGAQGYVRIAAELIAATFGDEPAA